MIVLPCTATSICRAWVGECVYGNVCARVGMRARWGGWERRTPRGGSKKWLGKRRRHGGCRKEEDASRGWGRKKRGGAVRPLAAALSRRTRLFFFRGGDAHLGQVDASRLVVCRLQAHREVRRGEVTRRVESRRVHRVVRAVRFAVCFAVCFAVRSARCSARCSVHWNQFRLSPARPRSRRICVRRAGWAGEKSGRWSYGRGVLWS